MVVELGGKIDRRHGKPLHGEVTLLSRHDGKFRETQPSHAGSGEWVPQWSDGYCTSVSADGRTLTLRGWGGTCATYAGTAREDSRHVYAQITSTPQGAGEACNAMAVQIEVDVELDSPLGNRTVVDETSNTERVVPVS